MRSVEREILEKNSAILRGERAGSREKGIEL